MSENWSLVFRIRNQNQTAEKGLLIKESYWLKYVIASSEVQDFAPTVMELTNEIMKGGNQFPNWDYAICNVSRRGVVA